MTPRTCNCGSGHTPWAIHDGHGIFLCYVCDTCRKEKIGKFRPDIFTYYNADEPIEEDE